MNPERLAEIERNHQHVNVWGHVLIPREGKSPECVICELLTALVSIKGQQFKVVDTHGTH